METELLCGAQDWFPEECESTGSTFALKMVLPTLVSVALMVGTGVFNQEIGVNQQQLMSNCEANTAIPISVQAVPSMVTVQPRSQIKRVRKVFASTVSEFANAFGVSRQAVYHWMNGKPLDSMNLSKLDDLTHAADAVLESGIPVTGWLLRRKIFDGKSLMEAVGEGNSAQTLARQLIDVVRSESAQRVRMEKRLAGRKSAVRSPESSFPGANDIEV